MLGFAIFDEVLALTVRFKANLAAAHFTSLLGLRPANRTSDVGYSLLSHRQTGTIHMHDERASRTVDCDPDLSLQHISERRAHHVQRIRNTLRLRAGNSQSIRNANIMEP
jgi:hypothetical protein